ncbi:MAG: hypothetical protein AAF215_15360 [Cyanobacteria bacterium P01_A01_bin.123]
MAKAIVIGLLSIFAIGATCTHVAFQSEAPLASLSRLNALDLSRTRITDMLPLANLNNLTRLNFYQNQIANVAPL